MSTLTSVQEFLAAQAGFDKRRRYLRPLMRNVLRLAMTIDSAGHENIPQSGPTLLMMNHMTFFDPAVITGVVSKRYVISMSKAELLDSWFPRTLVKLWGQFVINRGQIDRNALNSAIELLKAGHLVMMAPEGTRHPEGLQDPHDGLVYIAHKANAVIVPTAIVGIVGYQQRLKRLRRIQAVVRFGPAFRFKTDPNERLKRLQRGEMMHEAMYQLARTIPDTYASNRGVFANLENASTRHLEFTKTG
jgi:1-acyl-sn-glycerol-3-phosphate acyltransferase